MFNLFCINCKTYICLFLVRNRSYLLNYYAGFELIHASNYALVLKISEEDILFFPCYCYLWYLVSLTHVQLLQNEHLNPNISSLEKKLNQYDTKILASREKCRLSVSCLILTGKGNFTTLFIYLFFSCLLGIKFFSATSGCCTLSLVLLILIPIADSPSTVWTMTEFDHHQ